MSTLVQIHVLPHQAEDDDYIAEKAFAKARLRADDVREWDIRKRSIDARKSPVRISLQIEFWKNDEVRESLPAFVPQNVAIGDVTNFFLAHYSSWKLSFIKIGTTLFRGPCTK